MDQWILHYLKDYLTPSSATFLQEHILHPDSAFASLTRSTTQTLQKFLSVMYPIISPALDRLTQALYSSPDIVVLGFIAVILLVMLQILNWMRRVMMFWTRLAARFTFYAGIVALGASVYHRGVERSWDDAVSFGGTLLGWAVMVKDLWMSEYQRYEEQAQSGGYSGRQAQAGAGAGSWRNR